MSSVSKSRFGNSARNAAVSMFTQILSIVLNIIGRRVFVYVLDVEYLGVSTAFSSVLSILSLAELGVGSAIIYSLYQPIAQDDHQKIKALMRLYRQVYWIVGIVIFLCGTALLPFLDIFVQEMPDIPGVQYIYLLLVVQSAATYFFSYKINFLTATQQGYIAQKFQMLSAVVQIVVQSVVLLVWGNYYVYLIVAIVCNFLKNVFASAYVDKLYPFLKEKAEKLPKLDTDKIKKNVFALFLYKISQTLSKSIDTLLISKMLGVTEVAIYANYHLIINYSDLLFINVLGAITPSVGNLMTSADDGKKRKFFSTLQMLYYWVATYLAVGLIVLFNPLVEIWLGTDYLFPQSIVVVLAISTTLTNFQRPCSLMRDANGLFWYGKLRPLAMTIINLVVSIVLIQYMGTIGVVIGTCIAKLATFVWYDPYIVYKHVLKTGLKNYFLRYLFQWGLLGVLAFVCESLYVAVGITNILGLIVGFGIVTVIVNGTFLMVYARTEDFLYLKQMLQGVYRKLRRTKG